MRIPGTSVATRKAPVVCGRRCATDVRSGVAEHWTSRGVHVRVTGSGAPLLWLNGYAVSGQNLDHVVAGLEGRFRCLVVDHQGSGRSRAPRGPLTTRLMARDAIEVLDHVGVDSALVCGLSLGGMVAQELALAAPGRVRAVVLGATTAGGSDAWPSDAWSLLAALSATRGSFRGGGSVRWWGAVAQSWAALTHEAGARLQEVDAPALVMHGSRDLLLPPRNAVRLVARLPCSELVWLDGAGHDYVLEAPELVIRTMGRWLDERVSTPPPPTSTRSATGWPSWWAGPVWAACWPVRAVRVQARSARYLARMFGGGGGIAGEHQQGHRQSVDPID